MLLLRRLPASALPLLLLLAAQPAASLRAQVREPVEAATVPDEHAAEHALSFQRSRSGEEESAEAEVASEEALEGKNLGYMKDYQANLSHTRQCKTMFDKVSMLAPLVIPSLKLAFCYVPKGACTQFKDLINHLNHLNATDGFGKSYLRSRAVMLGVNKSEITRENGWKFAIFTRDPALRYLSAFGSTCVSKNALGSFEHKFECCGPLVNDNTIPAPHLVSMFGQRADFDYENGVVSEDDHWVSQTRIFQHCGENFNPLTVDYRGDISYGDVNKQVKEMLAMVNGTSPWILRQVDRLFPRTRVAGHQSPLRDIPPHLFFNNRSVLRSVMEIYSDDYKNIPGIGKGFSDQQLRKTDRQLRREWKSTLKEIEEGRAELHRLGEKERKDRDDLKRAQLQKLKRAMDMAKLMDDPVERFKFIRELDLKRKNKSRDEINRTLEDNTSGRRSSEGRASTASSTSTS